MKMDVLNMKAAFEHNFKQKLSSSLFSVDFTLVYLSSIQRYEILERFFSFMSFQIRNV